MNLQGWEVLVPVGIQCGAGWLRNSGSRSPDRTPPNRLAGVGAGSPARYATVEQTVTLPALRPLGLKHSTRSAIQAFHSR